MSMGQDPHDVSTLKSVPGRRRWPTVVLMIVVFAAGVAIGAGAAVVYFDRVNLYYRTHPEKMPQRWASRLASELDLSSDQALQVQQILEQRLQGFQEARRRSYPLYKPEFERIDREISALLTDKQKAKWDKSFASIVRMYNPDKTPANQPAAPADMLAAPATAPAPSNSPSSSP